VIRRQCFVRALLFRDVASDVSHQGTGIAVMSELEFTRDGCRQWILDGEARTTADRRAGGDRAGRGAKIEAQAPLFEGA
jgi:hypothetical protein